MFLLHPSIFAWDFALLVALSLCLSVPLGCALYMRKPAAGRAQRAIACLAAALGIGAGAALAYAAFVEPQLLMVREEEIPLPVESPVKIAVVSDMHIGPFKGRRFAERVVRMVNDTLPDLVLLPGGFIFDSASDLEDLTPLQDIRASLGVFAVLGNEDHGQAETFAGERRGMHDRSAEVADKLESLGIRVLRNKHATVALGGQSIAIAGIDDLWSETSDLPAALAEIPEGMVTILLSHNPSVVQAKESRRADLVVSGHTQGGQVRLPGAGTLKPLPISINQHFDEGVFQLDSHTRLAISRGTGETWARMRFLARPEIMVLRAR